MSKNLTNLLSSWFGAFASTPFPKPIQKFINYSYVKLLKLDMSEFEDPSKYETLNRLFTRKLKKERKIDQDEKSVISPCDSFVTELGVIKKEKALQIKGMSYSISKVLGKNYSNEVKALEGGEFINFYLSPKDYHRYHAPFDLEILSLAHIPGKLYPVNIPFLKKKKELFAENERVVILVKDNFENKHFIILVGALNVGKMVVKFEEAIETNTKIKTEKFYLYKTPKRLKKGECFGYFKMGSTVVILSQKDSIKYQISSNTKVRFGQRIGELKGEKGEN